MFTGLEGKFDIVYADPPWMMYGDPNKMGAAGKHYSLMADDQLEAMPVKSLLRDPKAWCVLYLGDVPKARPGGEDYCCLGIALQGSGIQLGEDQAGWECHGGCWCAAYRDEANQ